MVRIWHYATLRKTSLTADLVQACSILHACSQRRNLETAVAAAMMDLRVAKSYGLEFVDLTQLKI